MVRGAQSRADFLYARGRLVFYRRHVFAPIAAASVTATVAAATAGDAGAVGVLVVARVRTAAAAGGMGTAKRRRIRSGDSSRETGNRQARRWRGPAARSKRGVAQETSCA